MIDDNKQNNQGQEENSNPTNNENNTQQNGYNQPNNWSYGSQQPNNPHQNPNQQGQQNQQNQGYYYGNGNYQQGNPYSNQQNQQSQNNQRPPYNQYGTGGYNYTNNQYNKNPQEDYKWNFEDYDAVAQNTKHKPKKSKGIVVFASILSLILVLGVMVFSALAIYDYISDDTDVENPPISSSSDIMNTPGLSLNDKPDVPEETLPEGRLTTPQIANKVKPSVVGIAKYEQNNSFQPSSQGSGIIMTSDGYIVTNAHVVENAVGIKVVLNNGEEYAAELIGLDKRTDLAVIKINAENLSHAEFGNSSQVQIGEKAVAIGNPNGIQASGSVTQGIVSALDRPVKVDGYTMNFIQTDAAINPGNSGGALVNEFGQIIGINSAKMVSQDVEGICFAIPINDAMPIIDELIANGRVTGRPMLGITGEPIDGIVSRYYGVPMGVHIISVDPLSDLNSKGVVPGDIITKLDDTDVFSADDISQALDTHKSGDTVKLTIFRQGATKAQDKTFEVSVILMEAK